MKNIFLHIPDNPHDIDGLALATIVRTTGSTPQKAGSSALFGRTGLFSGTIGGGILEKKVEGIARKSAAAKKSALFRFALDSNAPSGEDALCGGSVTVLTDSDLGKHLTVFKAIRESYKRRIPGVLITEIANRYEESLRIDRFWVTGDLNLPLPGDVLNALRPEVSDMIMKSDPYEFRELESLVPGEETASLFFLQPVIPPPHLIIAGAGHIAKALTVIAQMLDFEITVIDDRKEFANPGNIPLADRLIVDDIGKSVAAIAKGRDTYIVIITRGHRDDASALKACIATDPAYIGMIGSRNKIALMKKEFIGNGWASEEQWNRVFAPIGVDINSKTVEEIAVSIAAQLVLIRNRSNNGAVKA